MSPSAVIKDKVDDVCSMNSDTTPVLLWGRGIVNLDLSSVHLHLERLVVKSRGGNILPDILFLGVNSGHSIPGHTTTDYQPCAVTVR